MKKLIVVLISIALVVLPAIPVSAAQSDKAGPINAKILEAVFIHYEKPVKPVKPAPELPDIDNSHYEIIGPAWDLSNLPGGIPFVINPAKAPSGAAEEIEKAFEAWDNATGEKLFAAPSLNSNSWWGDLDGTNNISWQVLTTRGAIAATWIWYVDKDGSGGMTEGDEVIENDIVFNASLRWGIDADGEGADYTLKNMYDVCNIATHEIGHVVGLDDLYNDEYQNLTMFGYGAKAETKKISLEAGDIAGTYYLYP